MELIKSVKEIIDKVLSVGKPSDTDVLYSEVIKREVPKESAEKLTFMEFKEKITHFFHDYDETLDKVTEFSRGAPTPPPVKAPSAKKSVKKRPAAKKSTTKKTTTKKEGSETKTTAKQTTTKKTAAKKPVAKETTEKKPTTKNVTQSKKAAAPKGSKRAEKIALYIKDIKKHYGEVDEDFVTIIVKNLGPSIYKKDAELVSCSDPKELDRVRKSFLMKKLGIEASQSVLDAAIEDVCQELKSTRTKYRATFYYALAKKFKKESVLS